MQDPKSNLMTNKANKYIKTNYPINILKTLLNDKKLLIKNNIGKDYTKNFLLNFKSLHILKINVGIY